MNTIDPDIYNMEEGQIQGHLHLHSEFKASLNYNRPCPNFPTAPPAVPARPPPNPCDVRAQERVSFLNFTSYLNAYSITGKKNRNSTGKLFYQKTNEIAFSY